MGKSLYIKKLRRDSINDISYCVVPIHGPKVDFDTVIELLCQNAPNYMLPSYQIVHIDIDCEVRLYYLSICTVVCHAGTPHHEYIERICSFHTCITS